MKKYIELRALFIAIGLCSFIVVLITFNDKNYLKTMIELIIGSLIF